MGSYAEALTGPIQPDDDATPSPGGGTYAAALGIRKKPPAKAPPKGSARDDFVGGAQTFYRALPFMGELSDAAQAGERLLTGEAKDFGQGWRQSRAASKQAAADYQARHPKTAGFIKGQAVGTAIGAGVGPGGGAVAAEEAPGLLQGLNTLAHGGGLGELGAALKGALPVAGVTGLLGGGAAASGEGTIGERAKRAAAAVPLNVAFGAGVKLLAPDVVNAAGRVADLVTAGRTTPAQRAARQAVRVLQNRAPAALDPNAAPPSGGDLPYETMGGGGTSLARAVANVPGPGQDIARTTLEARRAGAPERIMAATEAATGARPEEYHPTRQTIAAQRGVEAGEHYDAAQATPVNAVDFETRLGPLLDTPLGQKGLANAERLAENHRVLHPDEPITWDSNIIHGGQVVQARTPSSRMMDFITQGLDDALEQYKVNGRLDPSKMGNEGRQMLTLRNQIVQAAGELIPANAQAREAWRGGSQLLDATKRGREIVSSGKLDPEELADITYELTPEQVQAQRLGMARGIGDRLRGKNPQAFFRDFNNDAIMRERMRAGFGGGPEADPTFNAFQGATRNEATLQQRYNNVLAGSRTTPLAQDIEAANAAGEPGGLAQTVGQVVAKRIGGQSFRTQLLHGISVKLMQARAPALNDPAVSQILGEVLFRGRSASDVLGEAVASRRIDPITAMRLRPAITYAQAARGLAAGAAVSGTGGSAAQRR